MQDRQSSELQKDLEKKKAEFEQFSRMLEHEFSGPLRHLSFLLLKMESTQSERMDDEGRDLFRLLKKAERQLSDLHQGFLRLSKLESKDRQRSSFLIQRAFEEARQEVVQGHPQREVRISVEGSHEQDLHFPDQAFKELLLELFRNAVRFNRSEVVEIHLKVQRDSNKIHFQLNDNGMGVASASEAEAIFAEFHKLQGEDEFGGAGLGLAFCRRLVQMYQGEMYAEPREKGLSIFWTLPTDL